MIPKNLLTAIAAAVINSPEGFTLSIDGTTPSHGYCVADRATQDSFGPAGIIRATRYALAHGLHVGGWYDSKSGRFYMDATHVISDRETAIALGRENGQLAIFDLDACAEIRLDA